MSQCGDSKRCVFRSVYPQLQVLSFLAVLVLVPLHAGDKKYTTKWHGSLKIATLLCSIAPLGFQKARQPTKALNRLYLTDRAHERRMVWTGLLHLLKPLLMWLEQKETLLMDIVHVGRLQSAEVKTNLDLADDMPPIRSALLGRL